MPMMVINLGGEMMYILQQRLVAQNIPHDKVDSDWPIIHRYRGLPCSSKCTKFIHAGNFDFLSQAVKVVADIVRTMYNSKFIQVK